MKFIELFAGVGGMGWGLMQAGMECVGYVEWDKYAHQAYQILHDPRKEMWSAYDIRNVTDDDIRCLGRERGHISLITAGFPCQSFSIAGQRKGFQDRARGTLFFEVARFASLLRPDYLLLENVDGLRNHDNGRTLGIILHTLYELGYVGGAWQVLNSKDFGVPQNRERIFIVASLGGRSAREIFPFGRENSNTLKVAGSLNHYGNDQMNRVYSPEGLAPTIISISGGGREPKILDDQGRTTKRNTLANIAPTPRAQTHGNEPKVVIDSKPTQYSIDGDGIAYCLDAGYQKGINDNPNIKARRTLVIQRQFSGQYGVTEEITGTLQASRLDKVPMVVEETGAEMIEIEDLKLCECGICGTRFEGLDTPCPTCKDITPGVQIFRLRAEEVRAVLTPDRMEKRQNGRRFKEPGEPMFTLTAQDLHGVAVPDGKIKKIGHVGEKETQNSRVHDISGIMPTLNANNQGGRNPGGLILDGRTASLKKGDVLQRSQSGVYLHERQYGTLRAGASRTDFGVYDGYRIRKLTPLECFRLQSYPDWWYVKLKLFRHPELIEHVDMARNDITAQVLMLLAQEGIKEGISDSQLYKMAGNGVSSIVAFEIAKRILGDDYDSTNTFNW